MFKPVLAFLLFFCLLQSSFARAHGDKNNYQKLSREDGQSIDKLSSDIENPIQNITKSNESIFSEPSVATGIDGIFQIMITRMFARSCRLELLMMAGGSHLMFPISENLDAEKDQKIVAIAVSKLMMNLKTIERTHKMTVNVTTITMKKVLLNGTTIRQNLENNVSVEKHMRTFLDNWFRILDQQLDADTELNTDYRRLKAEAKEYVKVHPSMQKSAIDFRLWEKSYLLQPSDEIIKFINKTILLQCIVNEYFLEIASSERPLLPREFDREHHLLVRALIEKASSSESAVNQVYHGAFEQVLQLVGYNTTEEEFTNIFFNSIEKSLRDDRKLNAEIHIFMKRIEGDYTKNYEKFKSDSDADPFKLEFFF